MPDLNINFFGSSKFVVGILKNILENEGKTIGEVFDLQFTALKLVKDTSKISAIKKWLELDVENFKNKQSEVLNLKIRPGVVVSQSDKINRNKIISNPVVRFAKENNLIIFTPEKLNLQKNEFLFLNKPNSISVVASFGQIIGQQILDSTSFGFVNWHPSLLPKYRGPTPMQSALFNGDKNIGLSWIEVGIKMDAGPILLQIEQDAGLNQTIFDIQNQMELTGTNTWALAVLSNIIKDESLRFVQDDNEVTFCSKLTKEDSIVSPQTQSAKNIFNHWRAYLEFPGTVFYDSTKFKTIVKLVDLLPAESTIEGDFLYQDECWLQVKLAKQLKTYIKCADSSYLQVLKIRLEGGKELNFEGFLLNS